MPIIAQLRSSGAVAGSCAPAIRRAGGRTLPMALNDIKDQQSRCSSRERCEPRASWGVHVGPQHGEARRCRVRLWGRSCNFVQRCAPCDTWLLIQSPGHRAASAFDRSACHPVVMAPTPRWGTMRMRMMTSVGAVLGATPCWRMPDTWQTPDISVLCYRRVMAPTIGWRTHPSPRCGMMALERGRSSVDRATVF